MMVHSTGVFETILKGRAIIPGENKTTFSRYRWFAKTSTYVSDGPPQLTLTKYSCDQFSRVSLTKHGRKSMTN